MHTNDRRRINRRKFVKQSCLAVAGLSAVHSLAALAGEDSGVSIVLDPDDKVASAPPSRWAVSELQEALRAQGMTVRVFPRLQSVPVGDYLIIVAGGSRPVAQQIMKQHGLHVPLSPESLGLAQGNLSSRTVLLACGSDERGLVYAVLELADRVRYGDEPLSALKTLNPVVEKPANAIRGIARCFVSEVEDKPWFDNREMWKQYLSMLAAQRYNRFSLALGIAYNTPNNIVDSYFFFAYPFLVSVPGYEVRAAGLADAERDHNLDMLRFIGDETAARGMQFQLALWAHGYDWPNSPKANYPIQGLTPDKHAPYCRDALAAILKACPAIGGLTLRVHGESGVPDGTFDFWKTLFEAVQGCGRRVEIDMHAKGITQRMLDIALATGMPVNLSPKYWGEHMGLPYHQAAIRDLEMASEKYKEVAAGIGAGSRAFMRYGYGDLLTEDRRYGVLHRIWPGTQRMLLWGDPVTAAGYGRLSSFCGSLGVEFLEPLSFKGRRGSGIPGGRCAYADLSLSPKYDWEKYLYTYRVWGRLIYNPESDPEVWRRYLRKTLGKAAVPAEQALAGASRILPLVTTAHGPSANNTIYWPEIYTNMPIVDPQRANPYTDTPAPKRFGKVSPFDPQLFYSVDDFAEVLLSGLPPEKYSPLEVAQWLEDLADAASRNLAQAEAQAADKRNPEYRRLAADVSIQSALGLFFAWKLRSAVLWSLYVSSGDATALSEALKAYQKARTAWAEMAEGAKAVYIPNITYGPPAQMHGHWIDRLAAIDADVADMQKYLGKTTPGTAKPLDPDAIHRAVNKALAYPRRPAMACRHTPASLFHPGVPLKIELAVDNRDSYKVRLLYRHVNQAQRWNADPMELHGDRYLAVIAAKYTQTRYPIQYYFELNGGPAGLGLYPGFNATHSNLPYFLVRRSDKT